MPHEKERVKEETMVKKKDSSSTVMAAVAIIAILIAVIAMWLLYQQGITGRTILTEQTQCNNFLDDDADGAVDYPDDFSCSTMDDNNELLPRAQMSLRNLPMPNHKNTMARPMRTASRPMSRVKRML